MKIKNLTLTLCTTLLLASFAGHAKEVKIGMAIDDLRLERWQKDRDIFVKKAESLGANVFVQSANGNEETQMSQIENMINRGVDVLVIIPYNGQVLSNVVKEAKQEGIKVLAYDRMINNADIDYYISFDNEKVGELQAQSLIDKVPQGNYFLMGGSPVDNNAKLTQTRYGTRSLRHAEEFLAENGLAPNKAMIFSLMQLSKMIIRPEVWIFKLMKYS